jgi:hypothetical protein
MNKILMPGMLISALTLTIINTNPVQAQSILDIPVMNAITNHVNSIAAKTDIVTLIMNSCTAEFNNLDACVAFFARVDKHLTAAISESSVKIQS